MGSRSLFGYSANVGVGAGAGGGVAVAVIPPGGKVKEMYTSTANLGSSLGAGGVGGSGGGGGDLQAYSILNLPPVAVDDEEKAIVAEKFRNYFAYDEREVLIGCELYLFFASCRYPLVGALGHCLRLRIGWS